MCECVCVSVCVAFVLRKEEDGEGGVAAGDVVMLCCIYIYMNEKIRKKEDKTRERASNGWCVV